MLFRRALGMVKPSSAVGCADSEHVLRKTRKNGRHIVRAKNLIITNNGRKLISWKPVLSGSWFCKPPGFVGGLTCKSVKFSLKQLSGRNVINSRCHSFRFVP